MADADDGIHVLKEEEFFVAVCVDCSCVGDVACFCVPCMLVMNFEYSAAAQTAAQRIIISMRSVEVNSRGPARGNSFPSRDRIFPRATQGLGIDDVAGRART
jgi:hypothetical protein